MTTISESEETIAWEYLNGKYCYYLIFNIHITHIFIYEYQQIRNLLLGQINVDTSTGFLLGGNVQKLKLIYDETKKTFNYY